MAETLPKAVQIIVDNLAIDPRLLKLNASFKDDLCVDSLDLYELLLNIEKEFHITIPDEQAEKLTTVGALLEYLDKHATVY